MMRIITGEAKGIRLLTLEGENTRPEHGIDSLAAVIHGLQPARGFGICLSIIHVDFVHCRPFFFPDAYIRDANLRAKVIHDGIESVEQVEAQEILF